MAMTVSQLILALQAIPNQKANIQVRSTLAATAADIGTVTQSTPATQTNAPDAPGAEFGKNGPAVSPGVVLLAQ
jgi:hypothetical protein